MTFIDEVVAIKRIMALVVRMSWAFRAGLPAYNTPICHDLLTTSVFLADCEKNVRLKKSGQFLRNVRDLYGDRLSSFIAARDRDR